MSSVTDVCRRTWRKLGVRRAVIDELTAELEADLADAEADGISAEAFVGDDPSALARQWATERGLDRARLRVLPTAVVAVLGAIPGASFGLFAVYGLSTGQLAETFGEQVRIAENASMPYFALPLWMLLSFYLLAGLFAAAGTLLAVRAVLSWHDDPALKRTTQLLAWWTLPAVGLAAAAAMSFAASRNFGTDQATVIGDAVVAAVTYGSVLAALRVIAVLQSRGSPDGGYGAGMLASSVSR